MPAKLKHKAATQGARKSAKVRGNKQRPGRKGSHGTKADTPRVIANSFFALTAKPKPAIAVSMIQEGKASMASCDDNYMKVYADILKCVQRAIFLATGEASTFDPYKNGYDLSESFDFIFRMLKTNVIPAGWEYNIEQDWRTNEYLVVIYKACEFNTFWHVFDIGATVQHLYKKNRKLHDLFILFLHNFCKHTTLDTWWGGALGYVDESMLEDHFHNMDFETEEEKEEYRVRMEETIADYNKGEISKYQKLIKSQLSLNVDQLRKSLSKFSKKSDLVKWMYSACEVMEQKATLNDFIYPELCEDSEGGIMFDQQVVLLWDITDIYSSEQEEYLECESQGIGVMDPIYHVRLTKDRKELDLNEMKKALDYPKQFTKLYHEYHAAIKKYV